MNTAQPWRLPQVFQPCENLLHEGLQGLGLSLNPGQVQQLWQYAGLLHVWAKVINLTAITQPQAMVTHHLLDCLAALPVVDDQGGAQLTVLDVGAGAGLPGLVWAIAQPHWHITLVDAVQKKVAFMQQAIANLGLKNARAWHGRVELLSGGQLGGEQIGEGQRMPAAFDIIASRAFASMAQFVACSGHLVAPGGCLLAMKGRAQADEQALPAGWQVQAAHPLHVPFLDEERHLFCIQRYNATLAQVGPSQ